MTVPGISRAWPMVLFYVAAVFVTVKVAAALVLTSDGGGAGPWLALVPGLWWDVLVWTAIWALSYPLRRRKLAWGLIPLALGVAVYCVGSWTSFLITHTWMTWQRLRGDEDVTLKDIGQLGSYAVPAGVLIAVVLLWWLPAFLLARREGFVARLSRPRVPLVAAAIALALFVVDLKTARYGLFGLSEQPLIELVSSALHTGDKETDPLSKEEWERVHRPIATMAKEAPPPPLKEPPKNVVLYLAEGIATKHTSFSGKLETTPNLFRRYQDHGLWFDNFYTHTHRSIHAIFSTLCSEYPPATLDAMTALHPRIDCGTLMETLDTLPDMNQGLFHGGRFAFANKLAFLGRRGFDVTEDAQDLSDPEKWEETWWGIDDRAVVDAALRFVDSVPENERFFLLIIPIAPHEPYDVPTRADVPKKIKGGTRGSNQYLRAVQFADQTFERLMKGLEERGRYDETLTVWVADHGNHADEPARPSRGKRMLYQHNVHVPLVLLHPRSFSGERTHRLAGQIDLSPTLTAALGAEPDPKDKGQDLLSDSYRRRRQYLLTTRGASPFVGVVDGEWKFIHDIALGRSELYDLKNDPDERKNVADQHLARVRRYIADGVRFRNAQRQTLMSVPALPDQDGEAKSILAEAKLACEGECPKEAAVNLRECDGQWTKAPCLEIVVPANVPVEVELPERLVGGYDSLRVRWWNKERSKVDKAKLSVRYGDRTIPASPKWHSHDQYRVVPVPHTRAKTPSTVRLRIESPVKTSPVLSLTEH